MRLGIRANIMKLYNGHRSFYACLEVGKVALWLMRWDVARAPEGRLLSSDGLMGWTCGRRVS
jgi:hypothetical protein